MKTFNPGDLVRLTEFTRKYLADTLNAPPVMWGMSGDVNDSNTEIIKVPGPLFANEIFEIQQCIADSATFYIPKLNLYCSCHIAHLKDANAP